MIDLLWDYGELSAIVFLLICVWLWKMAKHGARDEFDFPVHDESYKDDE